MEIGRGFPHASLQDLNRSLQQGSLNLREGHIQRDIGSNINLHLGSFRCAIMYGPAVRRKMMLAD
jgi:hypothetical protein